MAAIFCVCLCFLNDLMDVIGRESELAENPQLGSNCFYTGWIFFSLGIGGWMGVGVGVEVGMGQYTSSTCFFFPSQFFLFGE